jgi:hypothetical protein
MTTDLFANTGEFDIFLYDFPHSSNAQAFTLVIYEEVLIRGLGSYLKIGFQSLKSFLLKGDYTLLASFAVNRQRLMLQV